MNTFASTSAHASIAPSPINTSGPGPRLMTASTLEGDPVINLQGDDLGTIKEIMLDVPQGRIAYAVMSCGGFLGMGDKLFALPWKALTLDPVRKCFVLDADQSRFKNAPGFDKDHWPDDTTFDSIGREIHTFWGTTVYWE